MSPPPDVTWQPSILETTGEVDIDESFSSLERIQLDSYSWLDFARAWVSGSDRLFAEIVSTADWGQRSRRMYDRVLPEPRLTSGWRKSSGLPLEPPILERMRSVLSDRYRVELDSLGLNFYRDGGDSVAWHRDRIAKEIADPVVAIVSVGEPRKFLPRRLGGGSSKRFMLGRGDLLVTGGAFQRQWEHSVPKVTAAGARVSITFRHGMETPAYPSGSS